VAEILSHCLLCGSEDLRQDEYASATLNLAAEHGVTQCWRCGLRFLNPRPSKQQYDQLYGQQTGPLTALYPVQEGFYGKEDARRLVEYRNKLDILLKHGAKGRILEIGSCTGVFLNEARQRGFDVEGIEPSEENRLIAREKFGLNLHGGTVEQQNFPDNSFDVVFSSHVFEHLLDPLMVAKCVARWLKPGRLHMMEVPNQFNTLSKLRARWLGRVKQRQRSMTSIHHTVFFSPKTLRLLARLSGCKVVHIRNVYYHKRSLLNPRVLLSRAIARLGFGSRFIELLARKPP